MHRAAIPAVLLLLAGPCLAQTAPQRVAYTAYVGAVEVAEVAAAFAIGPQSYRMELSFHLSGPAGALFNAQSTSRVDGRFQGATAVPRELFSAGQFRGTSRVLQIDWRGGTPGITQMVPPLEDDRDPVPAADQAHSIDGLSAMAALLHGLAANGRCEGRAAIYDGRRLSTFEAHTIAEEVLDDGSRSSFHGPALRCDFEGHQVAGFVHDADDATLRRPQQGSAWFARVVPGAPPVPVRIELKLRQFGSAVLYLTGAP